MNWYLEQKEAWNWKSMLPGGGKPTAPIQPQNPTPAPSATPGPSKRPRKAIEADKARVMMQINQLKGPLAGTPGAKEKILGLQQQYQQLLNESSLLHEMNYNAVAPQK